MLLKAMGEGVRAPGRSGVFYLSILTVHRLHS